MVAAQAQFVLGADHPARDLAAHLALFDGDGLAVALAVFGREHQCGADGRDRDALSRRHVGGAADNLHGLAVHIELRPEVHAADAQPVGVGVRLGAQHVAHDHAIQARAGVLYAVYFEPGHGEQIRQPVRAEGELHVVAEPVERYKHGSGFRVRGSCTGSVLANPEL